MTDDERQYCYEQWQQYKWKCEDFKEELKKYLEHYKPKHTTICKANSMVS